jgi:hypothetical protein
VADYKGEGQEQAARDSRDSRVVMMAVAVEDGSSRQQWWQRTMMATADDDSGGQQGWQTMTARQIGRRTTRGKEERGPQTTTAVDKADKPAGQRALKNRGTLSHVS